MTNPAASATVWRAFAPKEWKINCLSAENMIYCKKELGRPGTQREGKTMAKQAVTRKDVAQRAGVSETIVSYVLNNNRYVDKNKRERVLQAIKELNYHPNRIARALKGKKTNHIVFIADNISTEHFSQLIDVMDYHAYNKGYLISLISNRNNDDFVDQIISRQCDGVIISSISIPEEYIHQFVSAGLAVVVLQNRDYRDLSGVAVIQTGLYGGARDGVRFLAGQGRRNIVYVDRFSARGHFSSRSDYRLHGYYDEMESLSLTPAVITGCTGPQELARAVADYCAGHPVDAILGRSDKVACIAMQAVMDQGRRVPEDIAVVGFDNSSLSQYMRPAMTSIEIQRDQIGKAAVEMLEQMLNGGGVPEPRSFQTRLIRREST